MFESHVFNANKPPQKILKVLCNFLIETIVGVKALRHSFSRPSSACIGNKKSMSQSME